MLSTSPERFDEFMGRLADMAAGDLDARIPVSPERDQLDAIGFGINMLAGEANMLTGEVEAALRAQCDFMNAMAEEVRVPLSALSMTAELLGADPDPVRREKYVKAVQVGVRSLQKLVEDLHDISGIAGTRLEPHFCATDPEALALGAIVEVQSQAHAKGQTIDLELADGVTDVIQTDPLRAKQILTNLIGNAVKFTPRDGAVLVAVRNDPKMQGQIHFDVIDTGAGIPADQRMRLFTPFFRVERRAREVRGPGLGLALSRTLAASIGGEVTLAWSVEGQGSCFRLSLPPSQKKQSPSPR
jgi:signal transduction histidine kinase